MANPPRLQFSHIGFHVHDLEKMIAFYTELLGLELTDRGTLNIPGQPQIAFLSADPEDHHQVALVEGRKDGGISGGILNQVSFAVDGLAELRQMKAAAEAADVGVIMPLNHGNAWSVYFRDPEGNGIEIFTRSPFHVQQPVTDGLDLSQSDEEILESTRSAYEGRDEFGTAGDWSAAFKAKLEARWAER
jgi:catechol 2,3-dioxygenase